MKSLYKFSGAHVKAPMSATKQTAGSSLSEQERREVLEKSLIFSKFTLDGDTIVKAGEYSNELLELVVLDNTMLVNLDPNAIKLPLNVEQSEIFTEADDTPVERRKRTSSGSSSLSQDKYFQYSSESDILPDSVENILKMEDSIETDIKFLSKFKSSPGLKHDISKLRLEQSRLETERRRMLREDHKSHDRTLTNKDKEIHKVLYNSECDDTPISRNLKMRTHQEVSLDVEIANSQGFSIDHNVHFPSLENSFSNWFGSKATEPPVPHPLNEDDFMTALEAIDDNPYSMWDLMRDKNIILILLLGYTVLVYNYPRKSNYAMYVILLGYFLYLNKDIDQICLETKIKLFTVFDKFRNLYDSTFENNEEDVVMETVYSSQAIDMDSITPIITVFLTLLTGVSTCKDKVNMFLKCTKITEAQTSNIGLMLVSIIEGIKKFFDAIGQKTIANMLDKSITTNEHVIAYDKKVSTFVSAFNTGLMENMVYGKDNYDDLLSEGIKLSKVLKKNGILQRLVGESMKKLHDIELQVKQFNFSPSGPRPEPVAILLKGAPGVLKSVVVPRIASALCALTIPEHWHEDYKKNGEKYSFPVPIDKFWDSYHHKAWVVVWDDIFQERDVAGKTDSEPRKFINMVNTSPFPLPMAKIEEKNNKFFRSPFVLATTNMENFDNLQSVVSSAAVSRRFAFDIKVEIATKYKDKKGRFDPDIFMDHTTGVSLIPNDAWIFFVEIKRGNKIIDKRYVKLEELITLIVGKYYSNQAYFASNKKSEETFSTELLKKLKPNSSLLNKEEIPSISIDDEFEGIYISNYDIFFALGTFNLQKYIMPSPIRSLANALNAYDIKYIKPTRDNISSWISDNIAKLEIAVNKPERDYEYIRSIKENVYDNDFRKSLDKLYGFVCKNLIYILGGMAFIFPIIYAVYNYITKVVYKNQSIDMSRVSGKMHKQPKTTKGTDFEKYFSPQGGDKIQSTSHYKFKATHFGVEDNNNSIMAKCFNRYMYEIYLELTLEDTIEKYRYGSCWNYEGNIFILPLHFIFKIQDKVKTTKGQGTIILKAFGGGNIMRIPFKNFCDWWFSDLEAMDQDIAFLINPFHQSTSKGMKPYILTNADIEKMSKYGQIDSRFLRCTREDGGMIIHTIYTQVPTVTSKVPVQSVYTDGPSQHTVPHAYLYRSPTIAGDCGSPLTLSNPDCAARIIYGMHIAGMGNSGVSTPLTTDIIDKYLAAIGIVNTSIRIPDIKLEDEFDNPNIELDNTMAEYQSGPLLYAKVKKDKTTPVVLKTDLKKSLIYNKLEGLVGSFKYMPAKLKPWTNKDNILIDPEDIAFQKYNKEPPAIPYEFVLNSYSSVTELFIDNYKVLPGKRTILSLKEALHSYDNLSPISPKTSIGYPLCLEKDNIKKGYFNAVFDQDEDLSNFYFQRIAKEVEIRTRMILSGTRPLVVYKICPKDEVLPKEKVEKGKVRVFSGVCFIYLVMVRMYFGEFMSDFIGMSYSVGSAIGMNPYSIDWDNVARRLINKMTSIDDNGIGAGDHSGFDTVHWPIIHHFILRLILNYYSSDSMENNQIRTALYLEITNPRYYYRDNIYETFTGLPSGNPLTAIVNTIYHMLIMRIMWQFSGHHICEYNSNVYEIILGDDIVYSVQKDFRERFNESFLSNNYGVFNFKYTSDIKGEINYNFRKIEDVSFLKRKFCYEPSLARWLAPLDYTSIVKPLYWTTKGSGSDRNVVDAMGTALREISLYDIETFHKWKDIIITLRMLHYPHISSYSGLDTDYECARNKNFNLDFYY